MSISGPAVAYAVAGSLIAYSGIKGATIADTVKAVLSGNLTVTDTQGLGGTNITGSGKPGDTGAATPTAAENQAHAKQLAVQLGHSDWTTGQNWADWLSLWNQESGWSITAANPTSDARGIAQNINGYGPDYRENDATSQITWGMNYIAGRYGNPAMAWAHEQANNWY